MARLRKYHVNNTVIFVTFTIEEGLLLLPNPLLILVVKSSLALAQFHHPVKICHYLVEATHVHMILMIENPDDVKGFVERFKTESAHRINRILGREKRTVWCEGYDSPILLTPKDVIDKIVYIYTNPAKDNLEDSVDLYPGLSSWEMFRKGHFATQWKIVRRNKFNFLAKHNRNLSGYEREAQRLTSEVKELGTFSIHPNAWMKCFGISDMRDCAEFNETIQTRVRGEELNYRNERKNKKWNVIGRMRLINQPLNTTHQSTRKGKKGKKLWCICHDIKLRTQFISFLKDLAREAKDVYCRWKMGDFSLNFPLGMYPPSVPKLAHPIAVL